MSLILKAYHAASLDETEGLRENNCKQWRHGAVACSRFEIIREFNLAYNKKRWDDFRSCLEA